MPLAHTLLMLSLALPGLAPRPAGIIRGTVVNKSVPTPVPCMSTVVLQLRVEGKFVPFREMVSDARGVFQFDQLPLGQKYIYLIGANRDGIFYPGPRLQLTDVIPETSIQLSVCDTVAAPNPLVIRSFNIDIFPQPGALKVTESLIVDNPSNSCYVGEAQPDAEPVTLELAVPSNFERTTFREEFFGRRFAMRNGKLATGIPWPPGRRELKYTYILANSLAFRHWERPLDLPCSEVHLRVHSSNPKEVDCNLPRGLAAGDDILTFNSDHALSAGHCVCVELGHLPRPWMDYGRWSAVVLLAGLVIGAGGIMVRRRRA